MPEYKAENADLPEGFKMTEIGPLPEEWEVVRLGEVVDEVVSGDWGVESPQDGYVPAYVLRGTDFAHASAGNLSNVPIRFLKMRSIVKLKLQQGDILVELSGGSKDQPTGRVLLVTERLLGNSTLVLAFSNFVKRLRLGGECIPEFFSRYWQLLYDRGATRIYEKRTTGIRNFKLGDFLNNEFLPLPPLPEQRAIAHVLRTAQESKEATERVIAALKELKKSLMRHLFTYGPVPVEEAERVPLKETEVGPVPEHWEVIRLGEVAEYMKAGGTPSRKEPRYWEGGIPFVLIEDMTSCGLYLRSTKETISPKGLENSSAWLVPPGSLLLSMYATIGETAVNMIPVATNQAILAMIPKPIFCAEFGAYLLKFYAGKLVQRNVQSTQKNVNKGIVEQFPIPLPPPFEQREIASILQTVDGKIGAEDARKQALDALFKTLLHYLMTGKVRVPSSLLGEEEAKA